MRINRQRAGLYAHLLGAAAWLALSSSGATPWPTVKWPAFAVARELANGPVDNGVDQLGTAWKTGGYHSALFDTYIYFESGEDYAVLVREVIAYHNEHGLDQRGDLAVSFVPGEEELLLVHLRRKGPKDAAFEDLEYGVNLEHAGKLDGMYVDERTVAFIPDGVAPGDMVDFAYLILRRADRPFGPWDYLELDDYGAPVDSRRIEISVPASMALRQVTRGFEPAQEVRDGGRNRFVWQVEHLAPMGLEARLPRSFDPQRAWLITEARGWQDVSRSYAALIDSMSIDRSIGALAAQTVAVAPTDPIAALAAFVQQRIRYVALELRSHRLVPELPSATLARGWGDCKDMSLLLVQLLRSVGIEAYPALARTPDLGPVDPNMPSIAVFNHEIVAARRHGAWLFIDPTLKEASPPWTGAVWPGQRLLIIGGGHGLVEAGEQPDNLDSVHVDARGRVELDSKYGRRLTIDATTTYGGPAASAMRRRLKQEGEAAVRSEAAEFFSSATQGMVLTSLEADYGAVDTAAPSVQIRERLVFAGRHIPGDVPTYTPPEIARMIELPPVARRRLPIGLDHPREVVVRLSLDGLDRRDRGMPKSIYKDDGVFELRRDAKPLDGGFQVTWTARTNTDVIPAKSAEGLAVALEAWKAELGIELASRAKGQLGPDSSSSGRGAPRRWWLIALAASALSAGVGYWIGLRRNGRLT